jgi:hypothetical protein
MVCDSKENGGLGVLNLRTRNENLLLKHLHKFFNKQDIHGSISFGTNIMLLDDCQLLPELALSGGVTF